MRNKSELYCFYSIISLSFAPYGRLNKYKCLCMLAKHIHSRDKTSPSGTIYYAGPDIKIHSEMRAIDFLTGRMDAYCFYIRA